MPRPPIPLHKGNICLYSHRRPQQLDRRRGDASHSETTLSCHSRKIAFGCPARQGGEEKGLLPEAAPIL